MFNEMLNDGSPVYFCALLHSEFFFNPCASLPFELTQIHTNRHFFMHSETIHERSLLTENQNESFFHIHNLFTKFKWVMPRKKSLVQ